MSSLTYFNPAGFGTNLSVDFHYSQAVQLPGGIIKLSGNGGWDPITGEIAQPTSAQAVADQVDQAFVNVEDILRLAGSTNGWQDVYQVKVYLVDLEDYDNAVVNAATEGLKKWCPDHKPLLTLIPVVQLALEGMRVEIEVEAIDGSHCGH